MQLGILENDKLYLEYCPDVGGSIFKFQAKVKDNKIIECKYLDQSRAKDLIVF